MNVELMYSELGKRIRKERVDANMTQEELAKKAGISPPFVGHIERGTRKASVDTLVRLCNALKVSPRVLLQDSLEDDLLGDDIKINERQKKALREFIQGMGENY